MLIEPFPLLLAFLPLSAYLLLIGGLRLFLRPIVTTAARDHAALAVGVSGLVAIGPVELFFPGPAAAAMGGYVWLVLLMFYVLTVSLLVLSMPPKLVVYGVSASALLQPLHHASLRLDSEATLDASRRQVHMPTLGIRLRVDGNLLVDTAQVAAFEQHLSPQFWSRLLAALRQEIKSVPRAVSPAGFVLVVCGLFICVPLFLLVARVPEEVVAGFRRWLWR